MSVQFPLENSRFIFIMYNNSVVMSRDVSKIFNARMYFKFWYFFYGV